MTTISKIVFSMICVAAVASAAPIGVFGWTSDGVISFATSPGHDFIDFCPQNTASPAGSCPTTVNNGLGVITKTSSSGGWNVVPGGTTGTIKDITDFSPAAAPYTYFPPTAAPLPPGGWITDFMTLGAFYHFTAQQLVLQTCATTATSACIGPFQLTQSATGTTVTIDVTGILTDTRDNSQAAFVAIISGQYVGQTIAQVVAGASSPGGAFSPSLSAAVSTSAIPEPGTTSMLVLGAGMMLLSFAKRKRSTR